MKCLEQALYCAQKGWQVIPIYGVQNGKCRCSSSLCRNIGKHPIPMLVPNGLKNSTSDSDIIRAWFDGRDNLNYAIRTGRESGIFVVDIDNKEGRDGNATLSKLPSLPKTIEVITGGGGRHIYFKYPINGSISNSTDKIGLGIDVRGDNGYVLAPGSLHQSGRSYEWDIDNHPDETEMAYAPEWLLKLIQNDNSNTQIESIVIGATRLLDIEIMELRSALNSIPADNRDTWFRVGMALHSTGAGEQAYGLWADWSMKSDKYNSADQARVWRSMPNNGRINKETIFYLAQQYGWVNTPITQSPKNPIVHISEAAENISSIPATATRIPGALGILVDWMNVNAPLPQPALNLSAAITALGTLYSRKYRTWTDARPNVYTLGVAGTGTGKEFPRTMIKIFINAIGPQMMGGGDFSSGAGLLKALSTHPSKIFLIDEFGLMLESVISKNASSYKAQIMKLLLELYTNSHITYYGSEYANSDGTSPRVDIKEPSANIFGTTTPSTFYDVLKSKNVIDGFLPRILVFESNIGWQKRREVDINYEVPRQLIEHAQLVDKVYAELNGNMAGMMGGNPAFGNKVMTVFPESQAKETLSNFEDYCGERIKNDDILSALWSRAEAHVLKLSLIRAVSINPVEPIIVNDDIEWATELVKWSIETMAIGIKRNVSDNEKEKTALRVERIIAKTHNGITLSDLTAKTRFLTRRERQDILQDLIDAEKICKVIDDGNRGRKTERFVRVK